ncbi:hypothetical protein [Plastoroseomonas hellenica]|uniref:hypothetical protein n=1 Tax=Plastoroseomonas hellenica TaxID=2687306 RepID=UPI001BAAF60D|nr:hypothetical protein [Plastoroseomonas hellenica]MBR0646346.1 hypothetical protein [Plastoroseomonas hellenica]
MATLCVLLTAGAEAQPTAAPPPPATGLALRNAFHQGATLVGAAEGFIWTERYAVDGTLRGRYRGQSYVGRWTNENGELCTQPDGGAKTCHWVYGDVMGIWRDNLYLMLVASRPSTGTPAMTVFYRLAEPGHHGSATHSISGTVTELLVDGLRFHPDRAPPLSEIYVFAERLPGLHVGMRATIHATTDNVTFRATRVTAP